MIINNKTVLWTDLKKEFPNAFGLFKHFISGTEITSFFTIEWCNIDNLFVLRDNKCDEDYDLTMDLQLFLQKFVSDTALCPVPIEPISIVEYFKELEENLQ